MGRLTPKELNERKRALHVLNQLHNKVCGTCFFVTSASPPRTCLNLDTKITTVDPEKSTCGKWRGR